MVTVLLWIARIVLVTVFIPVIIGPAAPPSGNGSKPAPTKTPAPRKGTPTPTPKPGTPIKTPVPPPAFSGETITFLPEALPLSANELANPGRGLYRWAGQTAIADPKLISNRDSYRRFRWDELEPQKNVYDFAEIDAFLADAAKNNQRGIAGFVQPVGPSSNGDSRVPGYLTSNNYGTWWNGTFWPDYNDAFVLERLGALIQALGQRYGNDSRLAMVQMNHYGAYGEYHVPYLAPESVPRITPANAKATITMFQKAFPKKQLSALLSDSHDGFMTLAALQASPEIGWSRMSLGCEHQMESIDEIFADPTLGPLARERWKTAPVWTEMIGQYSHPDCGNQFANAKEQVQAYHISYVGNGNFREPYDVFPYNRDGSRNSGSKWTQTQIDQFVLAGKVAGYRYRIESIQLAIPQPGANWQVQTNWRNDGNAPIYEPWQVHYELRDTAGTSVWQATSQVDLQEMLPTEAGPYPSVDSFSLPGTLAGGQYELRVRVEQQGDTIQLAMRGQQSDGSYVLGTLTIP